MAQFNKQQAEALLAGFQGHAPRLYDLLRLLLDEVSQIDEELHPTVPTPVTVQPLSEPPLPPEVASYLFTPLTVRLAWIASDTRAIFFEVRKSPLTTGHDWNTSSYVTRTPALQIDINPISIGTHYYLIKSLTVDGVYSEEFKVLEVTVPEMGQITLTATVVDNTVMLYWSEAVSTFLLEHYVVRHILLGSNTIVGRKKGTFTTVSELVPGTYTYTVAPVDIAGNEGPEASIEIFVNQPPDFDLQEDDISDLLGTRVNVYRYDEGPRLLATVDLGETWESHFTSRGWTTPQAQITAGYPIYIQPSQPQP